VKQLTVAGRWSEESMRNVQGEGSMNSETALLRAAKRFEQKALAVIFDMYAPAIFNYALRLCRDPVEADGIVGDVFAKLLEQFAAGQGPVTNLRGYLFQIAYHCTVDRARRNHRLVPLEVVIDTPVRSSQAAVDTQVEERRMLQDFRLALENDLSEIQRHVIVLRFIEGFSLRETAAIVGKKVNHVKVIQSRGMAKLRKSLGRHAEPNGRIQHT
jgi:RNA polymerase sigma-70 factor (ECF subfamily)